MGSKGSGFVVWWFMRVKKEWPASYDLHFRKFQRLNVTQEVRIQMMLALMFKTKQNKNKEYFNKFKSKWNKTSTGRMITSVAFWLMIHAHPCWVYILERNLEYLKLHVFSFFSSLLMCITKHPYCVFWLWGGGDSVVLCKCPGWGPAITVSYYNGE